MIRKDMPFVATKRNSCAVCDSRELGTAIDLPNLPLTGIYCNEVVKKPAIGIDQQLVFCVHCSHAQLAVRISPATLYDHTYSFRTSLSATAREGTGIFLSKLDQIAGGKHFNCVLDIGCNDLYLLEQLRDRATRRFGIDPFWASKEEQRFDRSIEVRGVTIEDAELESILDVAPDLIVCRHTLEHTYEPRAILQKLLKVASNDALFLFEVPGFEALVRRLRFDQVFHQHLNYFSLASFRRLLDEVGGFYITHWENYHDWGAMVLAFSKRGNKREQNFRKPIYEFDIRAIRERYSIFQRQLSVTNDVLKALENTIIYGYGAAQMLPVLGYHLGDSVSLLTAVLDDDPAKDGMYYGNLPLVIRHPSSVIDLVDTSVLITAIDNAKPILSKLLVQRPRHIIYPFHII